MPRRRAFTFLLVVLGWVLFRADTLREAGRVYQATLSDPLPRPYPAVTLALNREQSLR